MANEIDELMDLDPMTLAKTPGAIDALILIMRNRRAQAESGVKLKKDTGPKQDIMAALNLGKPAGPAVKRRI